MRWLKVTVEGSTGRRAQRMRIGTTSGTNGAMHPRQRDRFVIMLVDDIGRMPADFEKFGYRFMERFHPAAWDHRGTNVNGAPVKSVVDSVSGVAKAAEYSTEKSYFSDTKHKKLMRDLAHVAKTHPTVTQAWMLSSVLATGGEMTRARALVANKYTSVNVDILDSRRIAEFVVDNLDNDAFLSSIADYLPALSAVRGEWALSHQIPSCDGYVERPGDEEALLTAISGRRSVVVSGVSGLGKSTLAAAVAERLRSRGEYELVLWQDAERVRDVEDLGSVFVDRFGERANLLGYLERRKCLLVLDNLSVDGLPQKIASRTPETRVLATSQVAARGPDSFELGALDRLLARKLLSRGLGDCPNDIFEAVHASVGGHPLLLSLLNGLVADGEGRWELALEFGTDAHELEDERRQRVCQRVLSKHLDSLTREFEVIRWCDSPVIDVSLLRELCGASSQDKLVRRHFISGGARGAVRVNDLVFASIRSVVPRRPDAEHGFAEQLAAFVERSVEQERGEGRLEFQRLSRVHRDLLARLLEDEKLASRTRAALRYAYALARDRTTRLALLGDPLADAHRLRASPPTTGVEMHVRAVIETIEATYTVNKLQRDDKMARAHHSKLLPAFEDMSRIDGLASKMATELEFHRCKALVWAGEYTAAESALRAVLETDPAAFAARVQLGRLLMDRARKDETAADDAVAQFQAIVAAPREAVSVPIVLAGFEMLRRLPPERLVSLVRDNRSRLVDALAKAVGAGLQQAFSVLAALGSVLWYPAEDLFAELLGVISDAAAPGTDGKEAFDWAQMQKSRAKMMRARGATPEQVDAILRDAIISYEGPRNLSEWERVQFAEALLLADQAPRALEVLDTVSERSVHWHHRRAQAHLALGDAPQALGAIDAALAAQGDDKTYAVTLLRERWRIRRFAGDGGAIADLQGAHDLATGRYRDELAAELKIAGAGGS